MITLRDRCERRLLKLGAVQVDLDPPAGIVERLNGNAILMLSLAVTMRGIPVLKLNKFVHLLASESIHLTGNRKIRKNCIEEGYPKCEN